MIKRCEEEKVRSLTDNLFSLEEPWRDRFLALVATHATRQIWDDCRPAPTRDDVVTWLDDSSIYRIVTRLLDAWQGHEERDLSLVH